MMPLFTAKPIRDLKRQKAKTLFILLSIIISLSIAGILLHTKLQFEASTQASKEKANVPDASLYTNPFKKLPEKLSKLDGIEEAEARISLRARADTGDGYKNIEITGLPERDKRQISKIELNSAKANQASVYVEASTMKHFGWKALQDAEILIPGKDPKRLNLTGTANDPSRIPAAYSGTGYLYMTPPALKKLGVSNSYTQIQLVFTDGISSKKREQIISSVHNVLEEANITSYRTELAEETFYIRNTLVSSILTVLIWFGLFSMILGFVLISHLFGRIIAEHVKELGIQRVLGAPVSFIWKQYFFYLSLIGFICFLCSAAAAYYGSQAAVRYLSEELNIAYSSEVDWRAAVVLLLLSFTIPYLGAFLPIRRVLRKPLTDSLRNVPHSFPSKKMRSSSGNLLLGTVSRRHAFAKKGQMLSNILMLSFGGAIIISCLGLQQTLTNQLNEMNSFWNYDQEWSVQSNLKNSEMTALFTENSGVREAEGWTVRNTEITPSGGSKQNALLTSLPAASNLIRPDVKEGNWLQKGKQPSVVINEDLRTLLQSPSIGDKVTLKIGREEKTFTIQGIIGSQFKGPGLYITKEVYESWLENPSINRMAVKLKDTADEKETATQLEKKLTERGTAVEGSETIKSMQERPKLIIGLIVYSILAAGVLFTFLGIMNLMTASSMNVYERQKEIGILRAIGGRSGKVFGMFAGESLIASIISWVLASAISIPLDTLLAKEIGKSLLGTPLPSGSSLESMLMWLAASILIGLLSSAFPVWKSLSKPVPGLLADQ
ncbi:FtsX-like permease family protein [Bacillus mangrovi]|uniref:FtsX-like permease family protein n=1 Tax=Metabacillus mangrovi TaxID=1491830 RepID=A0A7X2V6W3_9BACI|nr:ABC transporter permease [Metabacillus mangrovi]MTH55423.1 FtsX-like permease family protein [Metabacillus mangrovi]